MTTLSGPGLPAPAASTNARQQPSSGTESGTLARVARSEWTKMWSLRSTWWSLGATLALVVGLGALFSTAVLSRWDRLDPAERLRFDPTAVSLRGVFLAQLAIGVPGVLMISAEYSTGSIRSTMAAVPRRHPVLMAKAGVFAAVALALMSVTTLTSFLIGQAILNRQAHGTTLSGPNVAQAVIGSAVYLCLVGLLGIALGALLRNTAGAISALVALLLVLPILANFLPGTWADTVGKYLPAAAGQAIMSTRVDPTRLAPGTGLLLLAAEIATLLVAATVLLRRRDT